MTILWFTAGKFQTTGGLKAVPAAREHLMLPLRSSQLPSEVCEQGRLTPPPTLRNPSVYDQTAKNELNSLDCTIQYPMQMP